MMLTDVKEDKMECGSWEAAKSLRGGDEPSTGQETSLTRTFFSLL